MRVRERLLWTPWSLEERAPHGDDWFKQRSAILFENAENAECVRMNKPRIIDPREVHQTKPLLLVSVTKQSPFSSLFFLFFF